MRGTKMDDIASPAHTRTQKFYLLVKQNNGENSFGSIAYKSNSTRFSTLHILAFKCSFNV